MSVRSNEEWALTYRRAREARLLAILTDLTMAGAPLPSTDHLAVLLDCSHMTVGADLLRLASSGRCRIEALTGSSRRVGIVGADGVLRWTQSSKPGGRTKPGDSRPSARRRTRTLLPPCRRGVREVVPPAQATEALIAEGLARTAARHAEAQRWAERAAAIEAAERGFGRAYFTGSVRAGGRTVFDPAMAEARAEA